MFAVLGIAAFLRPLGYAWTAGITAALAFPYGRVGQSGAGLRGPAILAAWFILPIRARDVRCRRLADALAAASTVLAEWCDGAEPPSSSTTFLMSEERALHLVPTTRAAGLVRRGAHRQDPGEIQEALELTARVRQYAASPSDWRTEAMMETTSRDIGAARKWQPADPAGRPREATDRTAVARIAPKPGTAMLMVPNPGLRAYLHLATNAHAFYLARGESRQLCNNALFTKITITEGPDVTSEFTGIYGTTLGPTSRLHADINLEHNDTGVRGAADVSEPW